MVELGISTFGETTPLEGTGQTYTHDERIRQLVAEIELADKVGLDVYGIGEHHREDFAVSAPEIVLAAGAVKTEKVLSVSCRAWILSESTSSMRRLMLCQMAEQRSWLAVDLLSSPFRSLAMT